MAQDPARTVSTPWLAGCPSCQSRYGLPGKARRASRFPCCRDAQLRCETRRFAGSTARLPLPDSSCTPGAHNPDVIIEFGYSDTNLADYDEDHIVPLELGGAPRATGNLWPEPYSGSQNAHSKDGVETKTNWTTALQVTASADTAVPGYPGHADRMSRHTSLSRQRQQGVPARPLPLRGGLIVGRLWVFEG